MPTPRVNLPSSWTAAVAAACAITAGWMRVVGQVTAVVTGSRQAWERAPIIPQTNGLCPCSSFHGWIVVADPQGLEAGLLGGDRLLDDLAGEYSSQDRKYPNRMDRGYPTPAPANSPVGAHPHSEVLVLANGPGTFG